MVFFRLSLSLSNKVPLTSYRSAIINVYSVRYTCQIYVYLSYILVVYNNIQLLDETEQNIVIYQWRADQLFADAEGRGK